MYKLDKKYLYLFLIIIIGILLRFYRLADYPVQLNHDEVTQLYDAISIAKTQKDIYGNFMPFIFPSVGDFKPPFYTYITSFFYLIFGGGELTIRLPAAFFGVLTIIAVYMFVLSLLRNWKIATLAALLTAISPFEIFFSRKSFENGIGIFFMLLGFTCLINYIADRSKSRLSFMAAIFFGVTLYTYFSHAIIIPILLLAFTYIFRKEFFLNIKKIIFPALIFLFFLGTLLILIISNPSARYRAQTVFVIQDVNLGRQIDYSSNRYKSIVDFSFNRYLDQFNPSYIFADGLNFTNQGLLNVGPLLLVQFPFLILGIIYLLRMPNLSVQKKFILAWIMIGMLPSGLTFEQHSPHRSIMVFTMLNIISAVGLYASLTCKKIIPITVFFFIFNLIYFIHMYFVNFPFEKSQEIHYPFKQVALFAKDNYRNFAHIVFDPKFGEINPVIGTAAHYYLGYFGGYPPEKMQQSYKVGSKEREITFDKFSIRAINWGEDKDLKNTLIIGSPWSLPINSIDKNKIIKTFYFYDNVVAFYAIKLE